MGWAPGTARRRRWRTPERGGLPFADAELAGVPLWFRSTIETWRADASSALRRDRAEPGHPDSGEQPAHATTIVPPAVPPAGLDVGLPAAPIAEPPAGLGIEVDAEDAVDSPPGSPLAAVHAAVHEAGRVAIAHLHLSPSPRVTRGRLPSTGRRTRRSGRPSLTPARPSRSTPTTIPTRTRRRRPPRPRSRARWPCGRGSICRLGSAFSRTSTAGGAKPEWGIETAPPWPWTTTSTPPRWAGGANALASTGYACRNPDQLNGVSAQDRPRRLVIP